MDPHWLGWAKRLQAIAQNGLTFARDPFDIERYEAVRHIAAEMMAAHSETDVRRILDLFTAEVGYATPKVDVRGVVFRDNAILLVKERADNRWTLPGGWADSCESPSESVVREVYEEAGYLVHPRKLIAVYDRSKHPHQPPYPYHLYKLFFWCEITGGTATAGHETNEVAFFHAQELPALSLERVTPTQIARAFAHYQHPDWPADFD